MKEFNIKSQALEVNLKETKSIAYEIPKEHQWFLLLSEKYWGIHQKSNEFFKELHHPYSNKKEVVELFHDIAVGNFWICKESNECNKAIRIIIDIFDKLFSEKLPDDLSKHLVFIYLDFYNKNYDSISLYNEELFYFFDILEKNFPSNFFGYVSNIGYYKKSINKGLENPLINKRVLAFSKKLVHNHVEYWDKTLNIEKWYSENINKMHKDYSSTIKSFGNEFINYYYQQIKKAETWDSLMEQTFTFSDIIDALRKKINDFEKPTEQFCYIFYLLRLPGVIYHRNYLLIDLNNAIKRISHELNEEQCLQSIYELFALFNDFKQTYTPLILDSILTLGKEIILTNNLKLIHYFENQVIQFGFVNPEVEYKSDNWGIKVNPNHVKNIRIWLELIEYEPKTMKNLLSALVINLRLGGIFIFDTDLFQKDITTLLNSRISPIYKQVKQLSRIFPVYFSEIGAEGHLRDVSTKIDEISFRNDKLIHFLRKQVHTEGNNSHIQMIYEIIIFWSSLKKDKLKKIIPPYVIDTIDDNSDWVQGVHQVIQKVIKKFEYDHINPLLEKNVKEIEEILLAIPHDNENDKQRVALIIELYQLLKEKYLFETKNIATVIARYHFIEQSEIDKLMSLIESGNNIEALKLIFVFMQKLNEIIFNPEQTEGWENIYYKRHIAFGIPSMYGQYREDKFEALGLTFRLEQIASNLMLNLISKTNTDYFTAKTLKEICLIIQLLKEGISLDGITDQGFDSNLKMLQYSLTSDSFSIGQYINIFKFMDDSIKEIIHNYFIHPYDKLLQITIPNYVDKFDKAIPNTQKKIIAQKSEILYRELLSSAFLIQILDNLIGKILKSLRKMEGDLSANEIKNIMSYDPDLILSPLYKETPELDNQVFLGSKGYYQKKLYLNKFPVPEGFIVTTEVFRRLNSIVKIPSLYSEIDTFVLNQIKEIEKKTGLIYGNSENPLLLSVRSGAAISMPGAMNTFLNIGLNDEITEKLSMQKNFGWTSWDCYRRLLQTWGMSYGLNRNDFDKIMMDFKKKYHVQQKIDFSKEIMKEMAFEYKALLKKNNVYFEEDPFLQIKKAIISVFESWDTSRAKVYRKHMQIAEEWGTAVVVQKMIFGNLHNESGSGVLFTNDIQELESGIHITGDFSFLSQGEDIVAGLVNTLPISEKQRIKYYQKSPFSLETAFPKIYNKLKSISEELIEKHNFSHQEIEFTFETTEPEDLYVLQTRDMSIIKPDKIEVFVTAEEEMEKIGSGIGISKKVLNGLIVFDQHDLALLKNKYPDKNAILVRPDTVPDDIEMIFECEGLLTGKGGATSHAAVTASTLGKICIVNCSDMIVYENEKKCMISGHELFALAPIAIDGNKGIVYKGNYPIKIHQL